MNQREKRCERDDPARLQSRATWRPTPTPILSFLLNAVPAGGRSPDASHEESMMMIRSCRLSWGLPVRGLLALGLVNAFAAACSTSSESGAQPGGTEQPNDSVDASAMDRA